MNTGRNQRKKRMYNQLFSTTVGYSYFFLFLLYFFTLRVEDLEDKVHQTEQINDKMKRNTEKELMKLSEQYVCSIYFITNNR